MAQNKKTVKEWLSEVFGTGVPKSVSESVSAEEYNAFEAGGAKIQEQLAQLDTLTAEKEQLTTSLNKAAEDLLAKEAENADLQKQLDAANSDLEKYKGLYDADVNKGKGLPVGDASNRDDLGNQLQSKIDSLPVGSPDRVALEAFVDAQAKKKK